MQQAMTGPFDTFGTHNSMFEQHPTDGFSLASSVPENNQNAQSWSLSYGSTHTETPDLTDYSLSSGGSTPRVGAPWSGQPNNTPQHMFDQPDSLARRNKRICTDLKWSSTSSSSAYDSPQLGDLTAYATEAGSFHLKMEQRPTCLWVPYADGFEESKPCMQSFDSAAKLHEHIKKEHTGRLQKNYSCRWADCARFDKANDFKQRGKLERHMVTHSGCKYSALMIEAMGDTWSKSSASLFYSHICHRPERRHPFYLDVLDLALATRSQYLPHDADTHYSDLEFACHLCDKQYGTREQLKNHMTTHTGERRYQCRYCPQKSATATQHSEYYQSFFIPTFTDCTFSENHERTHTKEKPFKCPHPGCDYASGDVGAPFFVRSPSIADNPSRPTCPNTSKVCSSSIRDAHHTDQTVKPTSLMCTDVRILVVL